MIYQNLSGRTQTFYGVEYKPSDIKSVPGYINAPKFISVQSLPETVSDEPSNISKVEAEVEVTEVDDKPKPIGRRKSKNLLKEEISDGSDSN